MISLCDSESDTEFRKLAKDVYAFLQPPLVFYRSAGVIIGDRDVIVIDSLTNAAMTQGLLAEIRRVTDKPIRFLINTHSHAGHVYTNHLFPETTVISSHQSRRKPTRRSRASMMRSSPSISPMWISRAAATPCRT